VKRAGSLSIFILFLAVCSRSGAELPPEVMTAIQRDYPGVRLPTKDEAIDGWAALESPYLCSTDLNGDGRPDYVGIFLGTDRWRVLGAVSNHEGHVTGRLENFPGPNRAFAERQDPQGFRLYCIPPGAALSDYLAWLPRGSLDSGSVLFVSIQGPELVIHYRWIDGDRGLFVAAKYNSSEVDEYGLEH